MGKVLTMLTAGIFLFLFSISGKTAGQNRYPFTHLNIDKGLHSNHINAITQDNDRFMWFGTSTGLSKYDGKRFYSYRYDAKDLKSLPANSVQEFFHGPEATLWIKTTGGWAIYNKQDDSFIRHIDSVQTSLGLPIGALDKVRRIDDNRYAFIYVDGRLSFYDTRLDHVRDMGFADVVDISTAVNNDVYIVHRDAQVRVLDMATFRQTETFAYPVNEGNDIALDYRIFRDSRERLWLYAKNFPLGVFCYQPQTKEIIHLTRRNTNYPLNSDNVSNIQELDGSVWLGTDHGGINLFTDEKVTYLVNQPFDPYTLPFNSTTALYCSEDGLMWVGTYKGGASFYSKDRTYVKTFQHQVGNAHSLPFDDVNCFAEAPSGHLLIGTNGGGLLSYDRAAQKFTRYSGDIADKTSLSSNVVVSLLVDKAGVIWAGTYRGGLNRMNKNGTFDRFGHTVSTNLSVWDILEDSRGRFWIGTLSHGLYLFDKKSGGLTAFLTKAKKRLPSTYYSKIFEDSRGNIWLGTATGVEMIGTDGYITLFREGPGTSGLSNNMVSDIVEDRFGRIWVSTQQGVNVIEGQHVTKLNQTAGLTDDVVVELVRDKLGDIWMATEKGICKATVKENLKNCIFHSFSQGDGLQSVSFNENAGLELRDGSLVFGGPKGFNMFGVADAKVEPRPYRVQLSSVIVFRPGSANTGAQETEYSVFQLGDSKLKLPYNHNSLTLNLTDFDFLGNNKGKFQYIVENLGTDWRDLQTSDFAISLPNLSPGTYQVKVRYQNSEGQMSEEKKLMQVTVLAPWWRSGPAYLAYILFAAVLLFYLRRFEKLRERTRFSLLEAERYARSMKQLDEMKTRFFTNVSHEFRTPISLIVSPIASLKKELTTDATRAYLEIIERNAKQLYNLVGQLLDFNRMDKNVLTLNEQPAKLSVVVIPIIESFAQMAEHRAISFHTSFADMDMPCRFDQEKLEAIFHNLLSNAFKFTAEGGRVDLDVQWLTADRLGITVSDTGRGIAPENIGKIFERFYQEAGPSSDAPVGSGIGLAMVQDFVKLMGGHIDVQSQPGIGSTFTVQIVLKKTVVEDTLPIVPTRKVSSEVTLNDETVKRILIVEDNNDFAFFLRTEFDADYQLEICPAAEIALERIPVFRPDLIVSDVNLIGMSGIKLCQQVRQHERTKHIPFIVITAVADLHLQLEALQAGATDFISKPFHIAAFRSKVRAIISQQDVVKRKFKRQIDVKLANVAPENADDQFLIKVTHVIESNMANAQLTVAFLASELHMSRVGLYKRLLTLTGCTPIEFIRNIRLKRALDLLQNSQKNVSEVTYEVGFSSPKQFTKYFKTLYGNVPSAYRK